MGTVTIFDPPVGMASGDGGTPIGGWPRFSSRWQGPASAVY